MGENADASSDDRSERFRAARINSLLLKWSRGGRLSQTEFAEVKDHLPKDAKPADGVVVDLSGRTRYEKNLVEYEAIYKIKVRQLKKYIAIGKAANPQDFPPFDHPEQMLAWWSRHMKQRPPDLFTQLAEKGASDQDSSSSDGFDVQALSSQLVDAEQEAALNFTATARQLKVAYSGGRESVIAAASRRFSSALKTLKEAQQAARDERRAAGDLIAKGELLPAITALVQTLEHMTSTRRRRTLDSINFDTLFQRWNSEGVEVAREIIGDAVERSRENERAVLRRLPQFGSLDDIDKFQLEYAGE